MADFMRKRWDFSANPANILEFEVLAATAIEIGDLCWLNLSPGVPATILGDVKSSSHSTLWTGTLAGTLGKLAERFVGVAMSARRVGDPHTKVRVACRGVFGMPCASSTFEIGDLVGGNRDGVLNTLLAQSVQRIGAPGIVLGALTESMAIGKVTKREPVAVTLVEIEIASRVVVGGGVAAFLSS